VNAATACRPPWRPSSRPSGWSCCWANWLDASKLHPLELRQLLVAVRVEEEQREVLLQEATTIQQDLARQEAREPIMLDRCLLRLWPMLCGG